MMGVEKMQTAVTTATLLVIESDPGVIRLLKAGLGRENIRILDASTASAGVELAVRRHPDAILINMGLPDMDGVQLLQTIRSWTEAPILAIGQHESEETRIAALDAGADDFVAKPFSIAELWARIRAAMRRISSRAVVAPAVFEVGDLYVDVGSRHVRVRGNKIHLTPIEFKLLTTLMRHHGKVVTHRQLLSEVWGKEYTDEPQYLRVYVGYLRKKIEQNPGEPALLLTEPRVGYRLAS